ncbi:hypothetical protein GCU60_12545 [Blastococcus saxobsidens]|uniref:ABC transporter permease n=1 Tax=Blastococcus saxobsidens TaxID=138336 RepID=A0A6L9W3A9_9ACTN|nr:hypothetical protein [Blastococcus saxobsidens]NEK86576.1 hypothetical protein [Blastococcus saxobsidens]
MSRRVPFRSVVVSEWTKLRSVRSTWWCTALYLLVVGAGGWFGAAITESAPEPYLAVGSALTGFGFGQIVLVVLAVLAVTGEFRTGMVLASFASVPRRGRLLLAKTVVVGAWCVLLSSALALFCWFAATRLTAVEGGIPLTDPGVLRQLGVQVAAATLTGVLALGLGALLRSSAGALGVALGVLFLLHPLLAISETSAGDRIGRFVPALRVGEDAFLAVQTPWQTGLLVLASWAAAAWVLGVVLLERRDV